MSQKEKIIITYGTFDMFHIGHLKLLKRSKALGDKLYVGVSSDAFNEVKGKKVLIPYEQRAEIVSALKYVDKVFPEENWEQKETDIKKYSASIFSMGDDWEGKFNFLKPFCEVIYLKRTKGVSTASLKKTLSVFSNIDKDEMLNAFEVLERMKNDLA